MSRRAIVRATLFSAFLSPEAAHAHGDFAGLGDFYGGLLHPLVVPAELLAILAVALLLGRAGREACRLGLPMFAAGVAFGLLVAQAIDATIDQTTSLLLGTALVAGAAVASGIHLPKALAAGIALVAGVAIGIDARPDAQTIRSFLVASAATVLGSTVSAMVVAVVVLDRKLQWQLVAVRVAGSWIAACAILYFAWLLRSPPTQ